MSTEQTESSAAGGASELTDGLGGLHAGRLAPKQGNPREVAFANVWAEKCEEGLLYKLFEVPCSKDTPGAFEKFWCGFAFRPLGEPTQRDKRVAATLMQWLGSNVGMAFLEKALGECGLRITSKTPNVLSDRLAENKGSEKT